MPGENATGGTYQGPEAVFDDFWRRRDLATRTFQIARTDVPVDEGSRMAALTDGVATIRSIEHRWSTAGLYDAINQRIAAC